MTTRRGHLAAVPTSPARTIPADPGHVRPLPILIHETPFPDAAAETARARQAARSPEIQALAGEHADQILDLLAERGITLGGPTMRAIGELVSTACEGMFTRGFVERCAAGVPIGGSRRLEEAVSR